MRTGLLDELAQRASARGFDLFGVVDSQRFDRAQPSEGRCARVLRNCGTAIVLGCGPGRPDDAALPELQRMLAAEGLRALAADPARSAMSFACLGEAAGFGTVSPVIHRLLHPRYGAHVSVRAALLLRGQPFGAIPDASIAAHFQPCSACARPCLNACPADVHDGAGHSRFERCHQHRRDGGCAPGCQVVRACPVGSAERPTAEIQLERHREEQQRFERRHGTGVWNAMRRALRRP
jgi:hypothetical protein